ncbi:putative ABC transporter permease [Roseburia sp. 831b]|uniref:putative ABC transporter permease n=1 Tax=Roseburia sp. 831b TaxID=1261635 RepID=UPI0009535714|nr:putative ABC transporter permease [Roseburia sp. 831b]WVK72646.1 hypothetical protein BIV16_12985 [Roseburia sp. 831b]
MPQNFYELVWIFIIYAFIGWCTEVSYAALDRGIFVNRGFLNGPYCPVYGCGVTIVIAVLTPLKENLIILFIGSILLTSVLEYITGFLLEKVFHNKWWDYSDKPFNLHGYVCLKFSIYWGLACTFVMDVVHPIIYKAITVVPFKVGVVILCVIMTAFAVDLCVTVTTILKFNKQLKLLNEVAGQIHKLSDEIGEGIYQNVNMVVEKSEEFQENHADIVEKLTETKEKITDFPSNTKAAITEKTDNMKLVLAENYMEAKSEFEARKDNFTEKAENLSDSVKEKLRQREELNKKYQELLEKKDKGIRRLVKAFPDMKPRENKETLVKLRNYWKEKEEEKKQK